jgi:acyl-CoA reductase-like NAD-dependent aldehyde dehydrogenase
MITPFNFPVNLAVFLLSIYTPYSLYYSPFKAHKIAPAIAAGCPFIVKPSEKTPVSSILLAEIMSTTSLPQGIAIISRN